MDFMERGKRLAILSGLGGWVGTVIGLGTYEKCYEIPWQWKFSNIYESDPTEIF